MQTFYLYKSDKPTKKFYVEFINPDTGRQKRVYFGGIKPNGVPYEAYIDHKDEERKKRYINRHKDREDWDDLFMPGTWARFLLWGEPTLRESITDMKKRFNIKIIKKNNI
jgi:hypothetical protein